jgi:Amt family ammonium transporter
MTFKKPTRAGLVALVLGLLLGLFLSISTFSSSSYAEEAAAPAAAAPAADAAPPACAANADPKLAVLEKCSPNSGDTAWMLTSMALVLMMTIPGLGLFYGGMVRRERGRHRDDELRGHLRLVSILWLICTYSLAFRSGTPFIGISIARSCKAS